MDFIFKSISPIKIIIKNSNEFNTNNQILVGDKFGNITLLDLDKKSVCYK